MSQFDKVTGFTDMANITTLNRNGRKPGAKNRIQSDAKAMLEEAMQRVGGVDYLARQAEENPTAFLSLWAKLLPKNVNANVGTNQTVDEWLDALSRAEGTAFRPGMADSGSTN